MRRRRQTDRVLGTRSVRATGAHWRSRFSLRNWNRMQRAPERSSFSMIRLRASTASGGITRSIKFTSTGRTCAQVVLLSHDSAFLKLLWDMVPVADRKTLQLARVGEENTTIAEWNIERAVQARYRADIDTLQRFFSLGEGIPMDVIQKIEGRCWKGTAGTCILRNLRNRR